MNNKNYIDVNSLPGNLLLDCNRLPAYLFKKKFTKYLFFDADITSVDELIIAIKEVITERVTSSPNMAVFSYTNRAFLTWMAAEDDWVKKISEVYQMLHDARDYNGLIIIEASMKCVVHQPNPVSHGVFAFSSENEPTEDWRSISKNVDGSFFCLSDIRGWLAGESERDLSLVRSSGREYLETLIKNYG